MCTAAPLQKGLAVEELRVYALVVFSEASCRESAFAEVISGAYPDTPIDGYEAKAALLFNPQARRPQP